MQKGCRHLQCLPVSVEAPEMQTPSQVLRWTWAGRMLPLAARVLSRPCTTSNCQQSLQQVAVSPTAFYIATSQNTA